MSNVKVIPTTTKCSRFISIYSRRANGDLLTTPIVVRCSNPGNHFRKEYESPDTSFGVLLCDLHDDEEGAFIEDNGDDYYDDYEPDTAHENMERYGLR